MGILSALFGGGSPFQINPKAMDQPFSQRLTSGWGSEGGLLSHMGLGNFANQKGQAFQGRKGGLMELLNNTSQAGQQPSQQTQPSMQSGPTNLLDLIKQFQNNRMY